MIENVSCLTEQLSKAARNNENEIQHANDRFCNLITKDYFKIIKNKKGLNNVSVKDKHSIIALKEHARSMVCATDKNCGPCWIDIDWIDNEVGKLLNSDMLTIIDSNEEKIMQSKYRIN